MKTVSELLNKLNVKNYRNAITALTLVIGVHDGLRKDKITKEYEHPIWIASFLIDLGCNEEIITIALLHDLIEDHPNYKMLVFNTFPSNICQMVVNLTKTNTNMKDYYRKIKDNRYTSIVKGADRLHNLMTMVGVFSNEKMQSYIDETKEYIIPILQVWDEEYVCMRELDLINSLIRNIEYFLCKDVSRINQTIVQKRNGIELVVEQKLV